MDGCKYHLSQFFAQKSQKIYNNGIIKHAEMGKNNRRSSIKVAHIYFCNSVKNICFNFHSETVTNFSTTQYKQVLPTSLGESYERTHNFVY